MMELSGWALLEYAHRRNKGIVMSDQSGYTRIPNALLELLPTLHEAELRVLLVIIRKTAGWQKECDVISQSQLTSATKMSKQGVINGINGLLKRGLITREEAKNNGFCYQVVNEVDSLNEQSTKLTSQRSRQLVVNEVDSLSPQVVNEVDTQKKDLKEKKEKSAGAKSAERKPREKKDTTPEPIVLALADVCKIDRAVASYEQRQQLYQSAGILYRAGRKAGQSEEQIAEAIKYVAGWYRKHDWRGQKGQAPTPKQMRDVWRQAIDVRKSNAPPQPTRIERPADARPAQETASAMMNALARRNGKHDATP